MLPHALCLRAKRGKPGLGRSYPNWAARSPATARPRRCEPVRGLTRPGDGQPNGGDATRGPPQQGRSTPPAEALAAALAAQELRVGRERDGALPDWSLLDEVPNLGLPLRLLKPREDQAPGALDTPP